VAMHHVLVAGQAVEQAHTLRLIALVVDHELTVLRPVLCAHQPRMPSASYDSVTQHSETFIITNAKTFIKALPY